jgi:hypothetical protein
VVAGCVLTRAEEKRLEPDALLSEFIIYCRKIIKVCIKCIFFIYYIHHFVKLTLVCGVEGVSLRVGRYMLGICLWGLKITSLWSLEVN